jgi:glycerophosphoryl diester phosphodiesterase
MHTRIKITKSIQGIFYGIMPFVDRIYYDLISAVLLISPPTCRIYRYLTVGFLILCFCFSPEISQNELLIIAHRGGVVDSLHSENSIKALEEAIVRGYTHVEVDARITADGHVVCYHDDQLMEGTGIQEKISELPVDAVTQIILTGSKETIPTFEEYCSRAAGRIGIMVDLKGCGDRYIERYAQEIEAGLKKYGLLESALILINKEPKENQDKIIKHFIGKAKISWRKSLVETQKAAREDPDFVKKYYIFNHGADFTSKDVKGFQQLGLKVVVSINTGHYETGDPQQQGEQHVQQMLKYEVNGLQIDSCYDRVLFQKINQSR